MPEAAHPVFISYARIDQSLVTRAVEFLRGGGLSVFLDSQSIAYGSDWRQALAQAIEDSERVMLFWTAAAAMSRWVQREWKLALKRGKKVVPTLLDDTPLPPPLARLHAVTSLRGLFPAPVRRPEDLVQELVQANDFGEDEDPLDPDGLVYAASPVNLADRPRASSGFRLARIVGGLAVVGFATWLLMPAAVRTVVQSVRVGVPAGSPTGPVITSAPAPAPAPAASAPSPQTSSASEPVGRPPVQPAYPNPPAEEPALLGDLIVASWLPLLASVLMMLGGWLAWHRWGPRGRARAVVRELYAA